MPKKFIIKDLGIPRQFHKTEIWRNKTESVGLRQSTLIKKLLATQGMGNYTAIETPVCVESGTKDVNELPDENEINSYRSIVGSLFYLAIKMRPEIAVAASTIGAFVKKPTKQNTQEAKRTLRYLKGTTHEVFELASGERDQLAVYADANWG